jgi:DNA-binding transcriptional regulator GbsR (MarR family)
VNAAINKFVEQLGVMMDAEGYPRVAGQLLALLLVSPEPQSLDDLASQLDVSKASVSVNIRNLEHRGIVERIGHAGDRRDYYQVADDLLARSIEQRIAKWHRFHDSIRAVRKAGGTEHKAVKARLHDLDRAYEHMIGAMSGALAEWRARRAANTHPAKAS